MLFVLSKLFWLFFRPANLLLLLLTLGSLGMLSPWARAWLWGKRLVVTGSGVALVLTLFPLDYLAFRALEERIPAPSALPERVDGVVVLGGVMQAEMTALRQSPSLSGTAERLTEMAALARRYPEARVVFTSGSANIIDDELREADTLRHFLPALGLAEERVIIERNSRNTRENAIFSHDLLAPKKGEVWLLVTSAVHMPRAFAVFQAIGWDVVPYPVDYRTKPGRPPLVDFDFLGSLARLDGAMKEYLGLVYYRLNGWSHSLWPALESDS